MLLPQRYVFSSKSQLLWHCPHLLSCCCCYHKGTYFQANHNRYSVVFRCKSVVVATTKVRIFKQITTATKQYLIDERLLLLPQRYVFSSKSQRSTRSLGFISVVVATTKVRIFKQITTGVMSNLGEAGCCCYHKGTYFQANHNQYYNEIRYKVVVVATTKVRIFKQITTDFHCSPNQTWLLLLPQRYVFSSKSQLVTMQLVSRLSCCCYHKGTYFQANHNSIPS